MGHNVILYIFFLTQRPCKIIDLIQVYTCMHVTHACTHMHAPSLRELSGGHVSTPGDPAHLGPRVLLPPHCLSHTCHGGRESCSTVATGSQAPSLPCWVVTHRVLRRCCPSPGHEWTLVGLPSISLQGSGWGLGAGCLPLCSYNQPLGHGPGPQAEHVGPDAASTWSRASLAQQHGGEAGHASPPGTLCPAPPGPAA